MHDYKKVKLNLVSSDKIHLVDESGEVLESFVIRENLQKALELLKNINRLNTTSGLPIYKTHMVDDISVWAFHQQILFLPTLREYIKYEELIKFFYENKNKGYSVELDDKIENLRKYLDSLQIKLILKKQNLNSYLKSLSRNILFVIAKLFSVLVTYVAVLKLILLRSHVLVYTPDKYSKKDGGDFRFRALYNYLNKKRVSYAEVMHSVLGREFFKNLFERKKPVLFLESFSPWFLKKTSSIYSYDLSNIEKCHQAAICTMLNSINSMAKKSKYWIWWLDRIFRFSNIQMLISVDDPRYTNELITACKKNNIKTFAFEHGHLTKYHAGWMNYEIPRKHCAAFDTLFVWNQYWKNILLKYSTHYNEANVQVGGPLRPLKEIEFTKPTRKNNVSELHILVPYESIAPKQEIAEYMRAMQEFGITLYFKLRPDVNYGKQLAEYGVTKEDVKIVTEINSNILSKIDAVVGVYTTFLNEMIFYEKPIFILDTSFDLGSQLVEDNIAVKLHKDFEPEFILNQINNYTSKKADAWPISPNIEESFEKVFKIEV